MKFRNAIRKIAALGVGATMLGTTMMGALAADLSDYPNMFMKDHKFNAVLVVGSNAAPIDIVGAIDMAFSLQAAATETKDISVSGTTTVTASSGVEVAATGNHLNLKEPLSSVKGTLDKNDLPVLLADGTVTNEDTDKDYSYTQKLYPSNDYVTFDQNDDVDANEPKLYIDLGDEAYTLKVHFKKAIDVTDLDNSETITIMGKTYTFDPEMTSTSNTLVLYASQKTDTISVGETKTVTLNNGKTIEITCNSANTDDSTATLLINGNLEKAEKGKSINVEGTSIYISNVFTGNIPSPTAQVEFSVGSDKLEIDASTDWNEVTVNGDTLQGYYAKLDTTDLTSLQDIYFKFKPSDLEDDSDHYLPAGKSVTDPLFGTFKMDFAGATPDLKSSERTKVSLDRNGDKYKFTFTNEDGDKYSFDLYKSDSSKVVGWADDIPAGVVVPKAGNIEKDQIFILSEGDVSKVYQLYTVRKDSDDTAYAVIKDLTDDSTSEYYDGDTIGDTGVAIDAINYTAKTISLDADTLKTVKTKYDGVITINAKNLTFAEDASDFEQSSDASQAETLTVEIGDGNSDYDITIAGVDASNSTNILTADDSDSNWEYGLTKLGTYYELEKDKHGASFDLYYPESQVEYHVFFTPVDAKITTTAGGETIKTTVINKINVGAAKLDSEITDIGAQNLIVIGGPCVNSVASQLMGSPATCSEGFEQGKAIIKLFQNGDKVAMLVAGYSGDDTRRATTVLAKYDQYASQLKGTEVVVTGTTLSDITVSPSTE